MSATYPHDRLLARTILPWIPAWVMPNHLTILRLFLTPIAVWLIYMERYAIGIPFFLFTAFTDALDGSLARVRNVVTQWGTVWDPIADKVLIASVAVILLFSHFPPEITIIIASLEAAFLVGGYYYKRRGRIVSANVWGKLKMLSQVFGVTLYLLSLAYGAVWLAIVSYFVFALATVFALLSLFRHGI